MLQEIKEIRDMLYPTFVRPPLYAYARRCFGNEFSKYMKLLDSGMGYDMVFGICELSDRVRGQKEAI